MNKIFLHTYTNFYFSDFPTLCYQVCKEWETIGIKISREELNKDIVKISILQYQIENSMSTIEQEYEKSSKNMIKEFSMFEAFYQDFENNLKKILVSEFFKRSMLKQERIKFQIKFTDEKINSLFEYHTIKDKRSFFINQLTIWATYNYVIPFMHCISKEEALYIVFDTHMSIK